MSQQINLFNPVFLKQKKYFSVLAMLQVLGLIVLGSGFIYGYAKHQVSLLARQSEETAKSYADMQVKLSKYSQEFSPQKSSQVLQDELKRFEVEAAAQKEMLDTLKTGVIGNTEGYSEYMRAFARQTLSGLWLTGFAIDSDGSQMSMNGAALNPSLVPTYIQRLSKEKAMKGKTFSYLQMQQPKMMPAQSAAKSYVEFSMQSAEAHEGAK